MNNLKIWAEGFESGVASVLEFLREMRDLDLKEEYEDWSNADEYTKLNGEVVKRY